jgi:hypothetical protein
VKRIICDVCGRTKDGDAFVLTAQLFVGTSLEAHYDLCSDTCRRELVARLPPAFKQEKETSQ